MAELQQLREAVETRQALTRDDKMDIARRAIESGLTRAQFAESIGQKESTVQYWVTQYRGDQAVASRRARKEAQAQAQAIAKLPKRRTMVRPARSQVTAVVRAEPVAAPGEDAAALRRRLEAALTEVETLQKIVMTLGRQL